MTNSSLNMKEGFYLFLKKQANIIVVIVLLIALLTVGSLLNDRFLSTRNLLNVFEQSVSLSLVSLGQSLTILSAGIDLSVGSIISLLSVLTSGLIDGKTVRAIPISFLIILIGGLLGVLNGTIILKSKIHPLIVTLGMGAVLQGIALLYTRAPIGGVPIEFDFIAYGRFGNIPAGAIVTVLIFVFTAFLLRYSAIGRYIYAIGDDIDSAAIVGIPINKTVLFIYGFSGICCALAAIHLVSRFGVGQPYTGVNYTLASITPVIIGGTLLSGGKGGVIGTLFGVYLISLLNNLLNFMDISTHLQLVVQGLIIITAVSIYIEKKRAIA